MKNEVDTASLNDMFTIQGCVSLKSLSSFTHPQAVLNLHEFICSSQHERRYCEEHFHTMEVNGDQQLFGYQYSSKASFRLSAQIQFLCKSD